MSSNLISIDEASSIPKYRQIINCIIEAIELGKLVKGDKIPSLSKIVDSNSLSRDTVMMAFNELKARGVISSIPGKGYFIQNANIEIAQRIFVLFDELNGFKEDLYNSFVSKVDANVDVDIFFHHFNYQVFCDLITNANGKYTSYVIMPATFDATFDIISILPKEKVYILDRKKNDLSIYPSIYQDFESDVYDSMVEGDLLFEKYAKLIMVFTGGKEPGDRLFGFKRYCVERKKRWNILQNLENIKLSKGDVYLISDDRMLVEIVKMVEKHKMVLGSDIGVVSFNDTVLKEVVANGITTISTDFKQMGMLLADMIMNKQKQSIRNHSSLIIRKSL